MKAPGRAFHGRKTRLALSSWPSSAPWCAAVLRTQACSPLPRLPRAEANNSVVERLAGQTTGTPSRKHKSPLIIGTEAVAGRSDRGLAGIQDPFQGQCRLSAPDHSRHGRNGRKQEGGRNELMVRVITCLEPSGTALLVPSPVPGTREPGAKCLRPLHHGRNSREWSGIRGDHDHPSTVPRPDASWAGPKVLATAHQTGARQAAGVCGLPWRPAHRLHRQPEGSCVLGVTGVRGADRVLVSRPFWLHSVST